MRFRRYLFVLCLVMVVSAISNPRASAMDAVPTGFKIVLEDIGVALYQKVYKDGNPDYVQQIDLSQEASLALLHGPVAADGAGKGVYGGNNPRFKRQTLNQFWAELAGKVPDIFCMANGQFFYLPDDPSRLAFPLKVDGQLLTDGYGINEYPEQKLMLELWKDHLDIQPLTKDGLYASTAPDILGGLMEDANKKAKFYLGRTFVGIEDRNQDGNYETLFVFSTLTARQVDAAETLKGFGADKVMMLDGGGSTQLSCQGTVFIKSERLIPQVIAALPGPAFRWANTRQPQESLLSSQAGGTLQPSQGEAVAVEETALATKGKPAKTKPPKGAANPPVTLTATPVAEKEGAGRDILWIPVIILPVAVILFFIIRKIRQIASEEGGE